jgi:hypothetical protein
VETELDRLISPFEDLLRPSLLALRNVSASEYEATCNKRRRLGDGDGDQGLVSASTGIAEAESARVVGLARQRGTTRFVDSDIDADADAVSRVEDTVMEGDSERDGPSESRQIAQRQSTRTVGSKKAKYGVVVLDSEDLETEEEGDDGSEWEAKEEGDDESEWEAKEEGDDESEWEAGEYSDDGSEDRMDTNA